MIEAGRVSVNGAVVRRLPVLVDPSKDQVEVDGEAVELPGSSRGKKEYVLLYKPRHTVTTLSDPAGRRTVAELVDHPSGQRLYPVGRLDFDTMGLVLLTNDGELANRLTHPRFGVHKTYRAIVKGEMTAEDAAELERGIVLAERKEGRTVGVVRTSGARLSIVKAEPTRTILDITLAEGKNRQVRRMLAKVGRPVKKLVRISMGPLRLKGVALGEWRDLTSAEVKALRQAAGMVPGTPKPDSRRGRPEPMGRALRAARLGPKRITIERARPERVEEPARREGPSRGKRSGGPKVKAAAPALEKRPVRPERSQPVKPVRKEKPRPDTVRERRSVLDDGVVRRRGRGGGGR